MKFAASSIVLLALSGAQKVGAQNATACGPAGGKIAIAGSSTVFPIAEKWAASYMKLCPGVNVTVEAGGSSDGAGRVCNDPERGAPVDIGSMSRDWKDTEGNNTGGFHFACLAGDTERSATQLDVAIDGLSVVSQVGGDAEACIESMGGLTVDQLRWIFSNYTEELLESTGWDPLSLANSDGDDATHLWSELSADCPAAEIKIAGHDSESGTYEYFSETVFADMDNGESFDLERPDGYFNSAADPDIIEFLVANPDAIGYVGYAYYQENQATVTAAAIENEAGVLVAPDATTVADGSYNPLARRIFMNILDDADSMANTVPFINYGLMTAGGAADVSATGYVNIPTAEKTLMIARLSKVECPEGTSVVTIAGSSTVQPLAEAWSEAYTAACPGVTFVVEGGGSSAGAARVCGDEEDGTPVDIGTMSRDWKDTEATAGTNNVMACLVGDVTRSAIQVEVAIDGLSVVSKAGGAGATCLEALGGLTLDQLRWIFSNYTAELLESTGWDPAALANSDGDDTTHLWSELSADCPAVEIMIAGHDSESGTYDYIAETIFADMDNGESFDLKRPDPYFNSAADPDIIEYLVANEAAIGYVGYAYYQENQATVTASAIANAAGAFVAPTATTVADGTYNPLSRRIFMNLLDDSEALAFTVPFVQFGLGPAGAALVSGVGYVPIPEPNMDIAVSKSG